MEIKNNPVARLFQDMVKRYNMKVDMRQSQGAYDASFFNSIPPQRIQTYWVGDTNDHSHIEVTVALPVNSSGFVQEQTPLRMQYDIKSAASKRIACAYFIPNNSAHLTQTNRSNIILHTQTIEDITEGKIEPYHQNFSKVDFDGEYTTIAFTGKDAVLSTNDFIKSNGTNHIPKLISNPVERLAFFREIYLRTQ